MLCLLLFQVTKPLLPVALGLGLGRFETRAVLSEVKTDPLRGLTAAKASELQETLKASAFVWSCRLGCEDVSNVPGAGRSRVGRE